MAVAALVWQTDLHVRRIVAVHKVSGVATIAGSWCSREDIVDVAGRTGERGVRSGQGVAGIFQMVKRGVEPGVDGVAVLASGGEAQSHMINDGS